MHALCPDWVLQVRLSYEFIENLYGSVLGVHFVILAQSDVSIFLYAY